MGQLTANLSYLARGLSAESIWDVEDHELLQAVRLSTPRSGGLGNKRQSFSPALVPGAEWRSYQRVATRHECRGQTTHTHEARQMPIPNLTIIGETINDSVPSTKKLFDAGDINGILELARMQAEKGAAYIDVNVGPRPAEFMAEMVGKIQGVTARPLSIDTPDPVIAEAGLRAYDPARAGGKKPILNSVSALRAEMFDLYKIRPFRPILLCSENVVEGRSRPCHTAQETYDAAQQLVRTFFARCPAQPTTTASSIRALPPSAATRRGTSTGWWRRWN